MNKLYFLQNLKTQCLPYAKLSRNDISIQGDNYEK